MLLDYGVNTNVTDKGGKTALHNAARRGYLFIFDLTLFIVCN